MITDIIGGAFLSYRDEFHLRIQPGQLNVVIGKSTSDYSDSNGTGKTSLLKALTWALFGKYPGMEDADSVVNYAAKKGTYVRVFFSKGDVNYVVERFRKHPEHKNNVYLWEGTQQHAGDVKTVQEKITESIGMDYDIFLATLVFTGEREDEFAGGTDKEQKRVLNALLPLAFEAASAKAAEKLATAEVALENNGRKQEQCLWQQNEIQQQQGNAEKSLREWAETHQKRKQELQNLIDRAQHQIQQTKDGHTSYEANEQQWQTILAGYNTRRAEIFEKLNSVKAERTTCQNELKQRYSLGEEIHRWQVRLSDVQVDARKKQGQLPQEIEAIKHAKEKHCPTCGQTIADAALSRTLEKLEAEGKSLEARAQDEIKGLNNQINNLQANLNTIPPEDVLNRNLEDRNREVSGYENALAAITAEEAEHKPAYQAHRQAYDQIKTTLAQAEASVQSNTRALQSLQTEENPWHKHKAELAKKWEQTVVEANDLQAAKATLAADVRKWTAVKTMLSGGKGGLHHFVFEQMLPEMTAMAQMFLNFFSANTLKVAFRSHRTKGKKTIEGFFVEAQRGEVDGYGNLSRGEQRRINVAIALTLYLMASKHVFNPGILFLDEVADSLDQTGKQSIIELLDHFCTQYGTSAVLLTNERELIASVHHGYECRSDNGASVLLPISES